MERTQLVSIFEDVSRWRGIGTQDMLTGAKPLAKLRLSIVPGVSCSVPSIVVARDTEDLPSLTKIYQAAPAEPAVTAVNCGVKGYPLALLERLNGRTNLGDDA